MRRFEGLLGSLFWLPIFLGGVVGIALVVPEFRTFGIVCGALLALFLLLVLVQVISERRTVFLVRRAATNDGKKKRAD
jgi:hypothetical protein